MQIAKRKFTFDLNPKHIDFSAVFNNTKSMLRKNAVMFIALLAALITIIFVPIDAQYASYFDLKTLSCLFCVLAVVCAFKNINFFYMLAQAVVKKFKTARMCVIALVYITFIGSMLIANDMALLTFLPLGYFVLSTTKSEKYMAFTFIMQNIAANLGGMLTPFGNPQNLYLYTKFNIHNAEFMTIMAPPFIISIALITLLCMFIPSKELEFSGEVIKVSAQRSIIYSILFALSIAIVFRTIPYYLGLIVIPAALVFLDVKALKSVDYPLLLTFVFFFIFAGNMGRIDAVRDFFCMLLDKNTLLFSILSCQFISNVPSAILLSQFTENYKELLLGVNIGGVGTLISSLASLITFREYIKHNPKCALKYIAQFSLLNFTMLIVLTASMLIFFV